MIAFRIASVKNFMTQLLTSDTFDVFLLEEAVIKTANTFSIDGRINREFYGEVPLPERAGADAKPSADKEERAGGSTTDAGSITVSSGNNAGASSGAMYEFRPWGELKGLCFDLIKGRRTPLFFQFVLHLMPDRTEALLAKEGRSADSESVKAFVLTIRYDGENARIVTGTSYRTFTLSKDADAIWDKALEKYLRLKGIELEEL